MEPGSGTGTEDVICVSPFSSRNSILLRLHFYACFIAASYHIPCRGGRALKAADTAFRFHVSITTVEIWKTVYQLFVARTAGEPMDLDLFYNTRVVLLGLFLHTTCDSGDMRQGHIIVQLLETTALTATSLPACSSRALWG